MNICESLGSIYSGIPRDTALHNAFYNSFIFLLLYILSNVQRGYMMDNDRDNDKDGDGYNVAYTTGGSRVILPVIIGYNYKVSFIIVITIIIIALIAGTILRVRTFADNFEVCDRVTSPVTQTAAKPATPHAPHATNIPVTHVQTPSIQKQTFISGSSAPHSSPNIPCFNADAIIQLNALSHEYRSDERYNSYNSYNSYSACQPAQYSEILGKLSYNRKTRPRTFFGAANNTCSTSCDISCSASSGTSCGTVGCNSCDIMSPIRDQEYIPEYDVPGTSLHGEFAPGTDRGFSSSNGYIKSTTIPDNEPNMGAFQETLD